MELLQRGGSMLLWLGRCSFDSTVSARILGGGKRGGGIFPLIVLDE